MILVTGATGYLGAATIEFLLENISADRIAAFARDESKAKKLREDGIDVRIGHFNDTTALDNAMQGVKKLLLVSGLDQDRLQQHRNVIDAAQRAGVEHIVYTGVALKDAKASAIRPLMEDHFLTEDYIKESGLTFTFLRNSLYSDAIPMFAGEKITEAGIYLPTGDGKVPFVLRRDLAEATAKILLQDGHENKTYHLTGSQLFSFGDIAKELGTSYTDADVAAFSEALKEAGVLDGLGYVITGFSTDIKNHQYEIVADDLKILLGRQPTPLKSSLKEIYG